GVIAVDEQEVELRSAEDALEPLERRGQVGVLADQAHRLLLAREQLLDLLCALIGVPPSEPAHGLVDADDHGVWLREAAEAVERAARVGADLAQVLGRVLLDEPEELGQLLQLLERGEFGRAARERMPIPHTRGIVASSMARRRGATGGRTATGRTSRCRPGR